MRKDNGEKANTKNTKAARSERKQQTDKRRQYRDRVISWGTCDGASDVGLVMPNRRCYSARRPVWGCRGRERWIFTLGASYVGIWCLKLGGVFFFFKQKTAYEMIW